MADNHQKYFDAVAAELTQRAIQPGLWARAVAESGTDDGRARATYIRMRAGELIELDARTCTVPFSLSRVEYPFALFGSILGAGFLLGYYFGRNEEVKRMLPYICLALFVLTGAMRMRNLGHGGWVAFSLLIPIVNIFVAGELFSKPQGYAKTKCADKSMRIIAWIYYPTVIVLIVAFALRRL